MQKNWGSPNQKCNLWLTKFSGQKVFGDQQCLGVQNMLGLKVFRSQKFAIVKKMAVLENVRLQIGESLPEHSVTKGRAWPPIGMIKFFHNLNVVLLCNKYYLFEFFDKKYLELHFHPSPLFTKLSFTPQITFIIIISSNLFKQKEKK